MQETHVPISPRKPLSWQSRLASRKSAVQLIGASFESAGTHHLFDFDPAEVAERAVYLACRLVPEIVESGHRPSVTAACVLGQVMADEAEPHELRSAYAMSLAPMLQRALDEADLFVREHAALQGCLRALLAFHARRPFVNVRAVQPPASAG